MAVKVKASSSSLIRNLVSKYKFVPLLERSMTEHGDDSWEFEYESKQSDDAWHPSGDCTPSLFELYHMALDRQNSEVPAWIPSLSLRKTFMVGHFWHQWLQFQTVRAGLAHPDCIERLGEKSWGMPKFADCTENCIGGHGENCEAWRPIGPQPFHWCRGSADIAPLQLPKHGEFVGDFKTMNGYDYKKDNPPENYADKWECQLNIYMDFFDLEQGMIIGVCKDSPHEMKEWEYQRNQPLIDAIYKKWEIVSDCLREGVEPPENEEFKLLLKGTV